MHAVLGDPVDVARLEHGLNEEGAVRCLEVISEAVARLHRAGVPLGEFEPTVPWHDVRRFGNLTRHEYPEVNQTNIEDILIESLRPLRAAAIRLKVRFEAEAS